MSIIASSNSFQLTCSHLITFPIASLCFYTTLLSLYTMCDKEVLFESKSMFFKSLLFVIATNCTYLFLFKTGCLKLSVRNIFVKIMSMYNYLYLNTVESHSI